METGGPTGDRPGSRWQDWARNNPVAVAGMRAARALGTWLALVWLVAMVATWMVEPGLVPWFAELAWLGLVWAFLARTRTVSWAGLAAWTAACVVWALFCAAPLESLRPAAIGWFLYPPLSGRGLNAFDAEQGRSLTVFLACAAAPPAVLALLRPRWAYRLRAGDWLVLGVLTGLAFTLAANAVSTVTTVATARDGWAAVPVDLWPPLRQDGWPAWLLPWHQERLSTGVPPPFSLVTGVVTAGTGLAVSAWRAVSGLGTPLRRAVRVLALLAPVVAWWLSWSAYLGTELVSVQAPDNPAPPLHLGWVLTGRGSGLGWGLLGLLLLALLTDAARAGDDDPAPAPSRPSWRAWLARVLGFGPTVAAWRTASTAPGGLRERAWRATRAAGERRPAAGPPPSRAARRATAVAALACLVGLGLVIWLVPAWFDSLVTQPRGESGLGAQLGGESGAGLPSDPATTAVPAGPVSPILKAVAGLLAWWQLSGTRPMALAVLLGFLCLGPGPALGVVTTVSGDPDRPVLPGPRAYLAATTPLGVLLDAGRVLGTLLARAIGTVRPMARGGDRSGLS